MSLATGWYNKIQRLRKSSCLFATCVAIHRDSHLDPTKTGFNLQLFHQLPGLPDTHGAVHRGVSFHPAIDRNNPIKSNDIQTLI